MSTQNFADKTIWTGDNLDILRGMNSKCVDLIYLDPPFISDRDYAAPIGSAAAGAAFKDSWTLSDLNVAWMGLVADEHPAIANLLHTAKLTHGKGMQAYLTIMAVRLLEMRRVLKPTGSIYLHCDPTASHYLKLLMDAAFGPANFRSEINWRRTNADNDAKQGRRQYRNVRDTLLYYTKGSKWTWNRLYTESDSQYVDSLQNDWTDIRPASPAESLGYPTQKPLALLGRIIHASSNEGDLLLDPFAGCATACVVAENLGRRWVGIDISPTAVDLVNMRLQQTMGGLFHHGYVTARTDIPRRTDIEAPINYRQNKHVLFGRQEGLCGGCGVLFPFRNFTVDHIVPQSKGGTDHVENLQLLCGHCNSVKGDREQSYLVARLAEMEV